jgi:hypothetical protein
MPAYEEEAACWGFWPRFLKVGNELLVYATRWPGDSSGTFLYMTNICSRTAFVEGNKDLDYLGAGFEPQSEWRRQTPYLLLAGMFVVASLMFCVLQHRFSSKEATMLSPEPARRPGLPDEESP